MLLRHAEKPLGEDPPHGVTIDGTQDPESLTPRGWQRAGALVGLFVPDPSDTRSPRLPTPTHLFASQVGPQSSSERPRETLLPLAERLGLAVDRRFRKQELAALAQAVEGIDGIVLIAWEHHLIPSLATMLAGDVSKVPQVWPDDRYDVVWVVDDVGPGEGRVLRQVPEMLLAGDQPLPIVHSASPEPPPDEARVEVVR
jgi:broad specificity phosphatase PhoE